MALVLNKTKQVLLANFIIFLEDDDFLYDDDEEDDLNVILLLLKRNKRVCMRRFSEEVVPDYSEETFISHFRVNRQLAENISKNFARTEFFERCLDINHKVIRPEKQCLTFLWFVGHQSSSYRDVSDRFDITLSTLFRIISRFNGLFKIISKKIIRWHTPEDSIKHKELVQREKKFPGVLGYVDGTHIKIDRPQKNQEAYCNRKGFHSVLVQIICDNNKKFLDVFIGFPGSVHDARVFENSFIYDSLRDYCQDGHILGDSAYPCLNHVMTPFKDNGHLSRREIKYNVIHSKARVQVEHGIGLLKQRFRQLYFLKLRNMKRIVETILSCCVLHNLANAKDKEIFDLDPVQIPDPDKLPDIYPESAEARNDRNRVEQAGVHKRNQISYMLQNA